MGQLCNGMKRFETLPWAGCNWFVWVKGKAGEAKPYRRICDGLGIQALLPPPKHQVNCQGLPEGQEGEAATLLWLQLCAGGSAQASPCTRSAGAVCGPVLLHWPSPLSFTLEYYLCHLVLLFPINRPDHLVSSPVVTHLRPCTTATCPCGGLSQQVAHQVFHGPVPWGHPSFPRGSSWALRVALCTQPPFVGLRLQLPHALCPCLHHSWAPPAEEDSGDAPRLVLTVDEAASHQKEEIHWSSCHMQNNVKDIWKLHNSSV